jgi:hypothetical protein
MARDIAIKSLEEVSTAKEKMFASTDDWSEWPDHSTINVYRIKLGPIGREDDPVGKDTTDNLAAWIERLEGHLKSGSLKPLDFELSQQEGWQAVIDGIAYLESGKAPKKIIVKVQDL